MVDLADPGRVEGTVGFVPTSGRVDLNFGLSGIVRTGGVGLDFTTGRVVTVGLTDGTVCFGRFDTAGLADPTGRLLTGRVRGFGLSVNFCLTTVGLLAGFGTFDSCKNAGCLVTGRPPTNGRCGVDKVGFVVGFCGFALCGRGFAVRRPVDAATLCDRAEVGRPCPGGLLDTRVGILFGRVVGIWFGRLLVGPPVFPFFVVLDVVARMYEGVYAVFTLAPFLGDKIRVS